MPFDQNAGGPSQRITVGRMGSQASGGRSGDQYGSFRASLLYCPKCKQATPTNERLLLVLPNGDLYEYRCAYCGTSTGSRTDQPRQQRLILP
jgi:hypothetical protein